MLLAPVRAPDRAIPSRSTNPARTRPGVGSGWPPALPNSASICWTKDYAQLSATPAQFASLAEAVRRMQRTEPNYSARDLAEVHVPIAIVQGEHDEFIKLEHAEYLARSIPGAEFILLPGVSHFAPLQRPEKFNSVMLAFLGKLLF
jgi:pimeloyl-ACP methyl ester carboxylesterase